MNKEFKSDMTSKTKETYLDYSSKEYNDKKKESQKNKKNKRSHKDKLKYSAG